MTKTIPLERTKKGLPALWEGGGGSSNTGDATLIAGPKGEKNTPLYIRRQVTPTARIMPFSWCARATA